LYFRLARKYELANLSEVLIGYRENKNSITSKKNRRQISFVIKAKLNALITGQYSVVNYFYLLRDALAWLIPVWFKKAIRKYFLS
jgi:hypothetical protein